MWCTICGAIIGNDNFAIEKHEQWHRYLTALHNDVSAVLNKTDMLVEGTGNNH